ncbi:MAG: PEP-CTERM sorting domain-containing protein [Thiobacillus sp.]|uniref:exosortase-dependent surface protein XDP1 n=1 Tax=Thiobacillus sp. TaxID=924 RepID=UPI00168CA101|nr:exosortase-dependent surface protein XDP1 [Thiobacillus sp.]QLQ03062.1 MAG: PEP-CTERM sorting domain-containing protein [Thiobacillus sp.]
MTRKFWQAIRAASVMAIGLGVMNTAQATYSASHTSNCGGGGTSNPNCDTWTFNNQTSNTQGGITATASGWSNTVGSANVLLDSAYITLNGSSGLGVRNNDCSGFANCTGGTSGRDTNEGTSPEHAIDNNGRTDSILFSFTDKVNLTSFSAGWVSTDSDFSVLAYTGAGNPATLAGQSYADLLSNGWSLIGNILAGSSTGAHDFTNSTYSSYWLIGALNTMVGGDSTKAGNDYFKLISLAGCTCDNAPPGTPGCSTGGGGGVPEPGTLLLMGAGLLGLTRFKVRRTMHAAA